MKEILLKKAKASSNKVLIDKFEREWSKVNIEECTDKETFVQIMTALMFINERS